MRRLSRRHNSRDQMIEDQLNNNNDSRREHLRDRLYRMDFDFIENLPRIDLSYRRDNPVDQFFHHVNSIEDVFSEPSYYRHYHNQPRYRDDRRLDRRDERLERENQELRAQVQRLERRNRELSHEVTTVSTDMKIRLSSLQFRLKTLQRALDLQSSLIELQYSTDKLECAICTEVYSSGEKLYAYHPCKHFFHQNCYNAWKRKSPDQAKTCPLCQQEDSLSHEEDTLSDDVDFVLV